MDGVMAGAPPMGRGSCRGGNIAVLVLTGDTCGEAVRKHCDRFSFGEGQVIVAMIRSIEHSSRN